MKNGNRKNSGDIGGRLTAYVGAILLALFLAVGCDNYIYFIPAGIILAPLVAFAGVYDLIGISVVSAVLLYIRGGFSSAPFYASLFLLPAILSGFSVRRSDNFKKSIIAGACGFEFVGVVGVVMASYASYGAFTAQKAVQYLEEQMANAIKSSAEILKEAGQTELAALFSNTNTVSSLSALMAASLPAIVFAAGIVLSYIYVASCRKSARSFNKTSAMENSLNFMVSKIGAVVFMLCQFFSSSEPAANPGFYYSLISMAIILLPAFVYEGYGVCLHMLNARRRPQVFTLAAVGVAFLSVLTRFSTIHILAFTGAFDSLFDLRRLRKGKADAGNG